MVMTRTAVIVLLVVTLAASPLLAQQPSNETQAWRDVATAFGPSEMIAIRLKDGRHVDGTLLQISEDTLVVKPRTRVPVPARTIEFSTIDSIERKDVGWSPGATVVTGIAIGFGAFMFVVLAPIASYD
jgi:hypothetical protein